MKAINSARQQRTPTQPSQPLAPLRINGPNEEARKARRRISRGPGLTCWRFNGLRAHSEDEGSIPISQRWCQAWFRPTKYEFTLLAGRHEDPDPIVRVAALMSFGCPQRR